ncbi:MAG: hypothetical protein ACQERJ_06115 [Bacillota bacterium]
MQLCDKCIEVLTSSLSQEAIKILNKVDLFNELSERELARKLTLNHNHVKKLLYQLEAKLLLDYKTYGRTKAYRLTENGSRSLDIEQQTERIEEIKKTNEETKEEIKKETKKTEKVSEISESEVEVKGNEKQELKREENSEIEFNTGNLKNNEEQESKNLVWDFE